MDNDTNPTVNEELKFKMEVGNIIQANPWKSFLCYLTY